MGASLGYAAGPLNLRLAYNHKNSDVAAVSGTAALSRTIGRNILLAANYDFKTVKAYFAVGVDKGYNSAPLGNANNPFGGTKPTPSMDGNELLIGLTAPVGAGTVLASVMRKDDKTGFNQDGRGWGVGYLHPLSKRTNVYLSYGTVVNLHGAGYTVANNTESGSGDRACNAGVRHAF
jgi:predicted porin